MWKYSSDSKAKKSNIYWLRVCVCEVPTCTSKIVRIPFFLIMLFHVHLISHSFQDINSKIISSPHTIYSTYIQCISYNFHCCIWCVTWIPKMEEEESRVQKIDKFMLWRDSEHPNWSNVAKICRCCWFYGVASCVATSRKQSYLRLWSKEKASGIENKKTY